MTPRHPHVVYIGWDPSQNVAWNVAASSLRRRALMGCDPIRLGMGTVNGLYTRPTLLLEQGGYYDQISEAPMSTGHAIARFLVPALCQYDGWALFTDGDVLFRADIEDLFALADPSKALQVVHHSHIPTETVKMEGQAQTVYARKNWSSVVLWHCGHPANRALTVELVNTVPGRDLHRFCWLPDPLIGALPPEWNWLVNHSDRHLDPALVHFTDGLPTMSGYEHCEYSDEWFDAAHLFGYRLPRPPLSMPA